MNDHPYQRLAQRLDALPNGFPATDDGAEIRLLQKLFTPEEADLAAHLRLTLETPQEIAARLEETPKTVRAQLKSMARRGLIKADRHPAGGLGYGLLPFVVGIYEFQINRMDAELARLFEDYYQQAFGKTLTLTPSVHRVIPVNQTVRNDMEIHPYESAAAIIANSRAWGVVDCICRKQKALIGEPCEHPLEVCMVLSQIPKAFDNSPTIRALTQDQAIATLERAAEAGLVHSVSNNRQGLWYICNCCACSCGILRGMADLGVANVIARSAFINTVDDSRCAGCGDCLSYCQFDALSLDDTVQINRSHCVGCGVCVPVCPDNALGLARRPASEIKPPPLTEPDWQAERAAARGVDLNQVL